MVSNNRYPHLWNTKKMFIIKTVKYKKNLWYEILIYVLYLLFSFLYLATCFVSLTHASALPYGNVKPNVILKKTISIPLQQYLWDKLPTQGFARICIKALEDRSKPTLLFSSSGLYDSWSNCFVKGSDTFLSWEADISLMLSFPAVPTSLLLSISISTSGIIGTIK